VEAGAAIAGFTFSAAAVHAAIRLNGAVAAGEGFVALSRTPAGAVEVYGESQARPVYSAEFDLPPQRAAAIALSELRLPPATDPKALEAVLPRPLVNPVANDLSRNALPYAAALAGACPRLAPAANVLPQEYRQSNARAVFIPTAILGALVLLTAGGMAAYSSWSEKHYLKTINAEIARLDPERRRAETMERQTNLIRARSVLLDEFRAQTRKDLDALNELTRLIAPPAWTNVIDMARDQVRLNGEAPQAAPLLKILDSSPLFENSEAQMVNRGPNGEGFQIRANRRKGK
jgi:Tfp pilus assembly protein PilN